MYSKKRGKNNSVIIVRLDADLERQLDEVSRQLGRSRSDIIRDALRRQLALESFEGLRQMLIPFAESRGYLTDEDVIREIS